MHLRPTPLPGTHRGIDGDWSLCDVISAPPWEQIKTTIAIPLSLHAPTYIEWGNGKKYLKPGLYYTIAMVKGSKSFVTIPPPKPLVGGMGHNIDRCMILVNHSLPLIACYWVVDQSLFLSASNQNLRLLQLRATQDCVLQVPNSSHYGTGHGRTELLLAANRVGLVRLASSYNFLFVHAWLAEWLISACIHVQLPESIRGALALDLK